MNTNNQRWLQLVRQAADSVAPYSGAEFPGGYQRLKCRDIDLVGQRDCTIRHQAITLDWNDKVVLDLGCNQGGMLFEIAPTIRFGYGIDKNPKLINICHKIRELEAHDNLNFFAVDLHQDSFVTVEHLLDHDVDVCLLMAMCEWLPNWRAVIKWCRDLAPLLVLETNGNQAQALEPVDYARALNYRVTEVSSESVDDRFERRRRCFVCQSG